MEKIMLGMTVFFILGVVIYGFIPPGTLRSICLTLYACAFVYYLFNPLGPGHREHQRGKL